MRYFIVVILMCNILHAKPLKLFEAEEVSIDAIKVQNYRPDYWTEDADQFSHGANFNLNLRVLRYLFMDNRLHMLGTKSQIRQAGWEYRTGIDFGGYMQVFYYHHSQHVMERERGWHEFPLEDFYGVRFFFVNNKQGR